MYYDHELNEELTKIDNSIKEIQSIINSINIQLNEDISDIDKMMLNNQLKEANYRLETEKLKEKVMENQIDLQETTSEIASSDITEERITILREKQTKIIAEIEKLENEISYREEQYQGEISKKENKIKTRRRDLEYLYDWYKLHTPDRNISSELVNDMDDKEVLYAYTKLVESIGNDKTVNDRIREARLAKTRKDIKNRNTNGIDNQNISNEVVKENNQEEEKIIKDVANFELNVNKLIEEIEKIEKTLVLGTVLDEDLTDDIKKIQESFEEIEKESESLRNEIDDFKKEHSNLDIKSIDKKEVLKIRNDLDKLRKRIRDLKKLHISRYNEQVDILNTKLNELKNDNTLSDELKLRLNSLLPLSRCDKKITQYNTKYYDNIKYDDMINLNHELNDIYMQLGKKEKPATKNNEEKIEEVLNNDKPDVNKESLSYYTGFNRRLDSLEEKITRSFDLTITLTNELDENINNYFIGEINKYNKELTEIENLVDALYESKNINLEQYNNLKDRIENLKKLVDSKKEYINQVDIIDDLYKALNGRVDGIEDAINQLEKLVDSEDKIKDKNVKKQIEDSIKKIKEEIRKIENELESYANSDKYSQEDDLKIQKRLDNAKKRLVEIEKKYKKKKAFKVVDAISASKVYKKHPKAVIIAAGLATLGLTIAGAYALFPAIIQGNILLASRIPLLRNTFININKILTKLIGGKSVEVAAGKGFFWYTSNGELINPGCMDPITGLLRGLAQSGIVTAGYLTGVVTLIKKCNELIKKYRLEHKKEETTELSVINNEEEQELGGNTRGR